MCNRLPPRLYQPGLKAWVWFLCFALLLAACRATPALPTVTPTISQNQAQSTRTSTSGRAPDGDYNTVTPSPTAVSRAEPVSAVRVRAILGKPESVFDYSRDTCRAAGGYDLPDAPARAIRLGNGEIMLASSNPPNNSLLYGNDFNSLKHSCAMSLPSSNSPDAFTFDNQEWILSLYRDGDIIHALIHNEYHDPYADNCLPGITTSENPCWYNAITCAYSQFVSEP